MSSFTWVTESQFGKQFGEQLSKLVTVTSKGVRKIACPVNKLFLFSIKMAENQLNSIAQRLAL